MNNLKEEEPSHKLRTKLHKQLMSRMNRDRRILKGCFIKYSPRFQINDIDINCIERNKKSLAGDNKKTYRQFDV